MLHIFGHKLEAVLKMVAYSQCVLLSPNLFQKSEHKIDTTREPLVYNPILSRFVYAGCNS